MMKTQPIFQLMLFFIVVSVVSCKKIDGYVIDDSPCIELSLEVPRTLQTKSTQVDGMISEDLLREFIRCFRKEKSVKEIRAVESDGVVLSYIVNYDKGWEIFAADSRYQISLAKDEKGNFAYESLPTGLKVWFDGLNDSIKATIDSPYFDNEYTRIWKRLKTNKVDKILTKSMGSGYWFKVRKDSWIEDESIVVEIEPMTDTKWGQGDPWNYKCPLDYNSSGEIVRCPTGCTAVAISQALYYFQQVGYRQIGLYHTINTSGYVGSFIFQRSNYVANSNRWVQMAQVSSDPGTEYVGDLMVDVGNRVSMTYSAGHSGAWPSSAALSNYGLSCSNSDYRVGYVWTDLCNHKPVIVVSWGRDDDSGRYGHTWLIVGGLRIMEQYATEYEWIYSPDFESFDGNYSEVISEEDMLYYDWDQYEPGNSENSIIEYDVNYIEYIRMNWGYNGAYQSAYYSIKPADGWDVGACRYEFDTTIYYDIH